MNERLVELKSIAAQMDALRAEIMQKALDGTINKVVPQNKSLKEMGYPNNILAVEAARAIKQDRGAPIGMAALLAQWEKGDNTSVAKLGTVREKLATCEYDKHTWTDEQKAVLEALRSHDALIITQLVSTLLWHRKGLDFANAQNEKLEQRVKAMEGQVSRQQEVNDRLITRIERLEAMQVTGEAAAPPEAYGGTSPPNTGGKFSAAAVVLESAKTGADAELMSAEVKAKVEERAQKEMDELVAAVEGFAQKAAKDFFITDVVKCGAYGKDFPKIVEAATSAGETHWPSLLFMMKQIAHTTYGKDEETYAKILELADKYFEKAREFEALNHPRILHAINQAFHCVAAAAICSLGVKYLRLDEKRIEDYNNGWNARYKIEGRVDRLEKKQVELEGVAARTVGDEWLKNIKTNTARPDVDKVMARQAFLRKMENALDEAMNLIGQQWIMINGKRAIVIGGVVYVQQGKNLEALIED